MSVSICSPRFAVHINFRFLMVQRTIIYFYLHILHVYTACTRATVGISSMITIVPSVWVHLCGYYIATLFQWEKLTSKEWYHLVAYTVSCYARCSTSRSDNALNVMYVLVCNLSIFSLSLFLYLVRRIPTFVGKLVETLLQQHNNGFCEECADDACTDIDFKHLSAGKCTK